MTPSHQPTHRETVVESFSNTREQETCSQSVNNMHMAWQPALERKCTQSLLWAKARFQDSLVKRACGHTMCVSQGCAWKDGQAGSSRVGPHTGFVPQDWWSLGATTILSTALACLRPQLLHNVTWSPLAPAYLAEAAGGRFLSLATDTSQADRGRNSMVSLFPAIVPSPPRDLTASPPTSPCPVLKWNGTSRNEQVPRVWRAVGREGA